MGRSKKLITVICLTFLTAVFIALGHYLFSYAESQNQIGREANIVVNQIGYLPRGQKLAFLINKTKNSQQPAQLVNLKTNQVMLRIIPGKIKADPLSNDSLQSLDFSNFQKKGKYYLRVGELQSVAFAIGKDIYQDSLIKLLRSFYLQRCGIAIQDLVTGITHAPCHLKDGILAHKDRVNQQGKQLAAVGGWHDAGDYGKYVTTTAVAIGRLLSLYEQYPDKFTDGQLQIPESGNGIPDLLDEVKVGLDWLQTMQRQDGAVYRKLSGKSWPIGKAPDEDNQKRYVYGISTAETAKFAAVMAMAARIYQPLNQDLANAYLEAAERAWRFLQNEPRMRDDWVEGDDSGSGKYLYSETDTEAALKTDLDDRFWAAAEFLITTGKQEFKQYFRQYLDQFDYTLFEWKDPSPLGMSDYLWQQRQPVDAEIKQKIKAKLLARADDLLSKVSQAGYRTANHRFIWGSNKMTVEEGITLTYAYKLTGNRAYLDGAIDQLDYVLGRNHFNQTFVTGVGTHPVRRVNHIWAKTKQILIPGLFVGGPNDKAQDGIAPKGLGILSYLDDERSYATNEYAIDYNSSLIALIVVLESM